MKAIVIAPNEKQYQYFITTNNLNSQEYPYINSASKLRGYRDCKLIRAGEYANMEDASNIEAYALAHNIEIVELA